MSANLHISIDNQSIKQPSKIDYLYFLRDLSPYAILTINTNNYGKYAQTLSHEIKARFLNNDVSRLMMVFEEMYWNTHKVTRQVGYHDRFHGIGFVEKLETNPHVHILLFFPDSVSFISEAERRIEIDRRMHFLVSEFLKTGDEAKLYVRDQQYKSYPKVAEWEYLHHQITGKITRRRKGAVKSVFPGGEFHVASIENTEQDLKQVTGYTAKELSDRKIANDSGFFLLSEKMSFNHYRGPTKLPALGGYSAIH